MKETHRSPLKLILGIVTVFLLLLLLGAGILYLKIQEPAKRSADFARLQQESYQGVFFSMCAPERIPIVYRNTFNHVNMRTHDAILY